MTRRKHLQFGDAEIDLAEADRLAGTALKLTQPACPLHGAYFNHGKKDVY